MKHAKALKITYADSGDGHREERLMPLPFLRRFNGYDIGSTKTNHLVLRDASVCPRHARIVQPVPGEFSLLHLETGRADSVSVDGRWLEPGESAPLPGGCTFNIGAVQLLFEIIYHT